MKIRLSAILLGLICFLGGPRIHAADPPKPVLKPLTPQPQEKPEPPKPAWPTLEWKKAAPSPFARVESPAAVVNGKLYLFGGFTDELDASNQVDVYDPAQDTWARKKDMPARLTHLNPASDGKIIWFAGGFKGKHPGPVTAEVWKYDTVTDTWTAAA
jgi:N-acetylneuraminic acid mutarotase